MSKKTTSKKSEQNLELLEQDHFHEKNNKRYSYTSNMLIKSENYIFDYIDKGLLNSGDIDKDIAQGINSIQNLLEKYQEITQSEVKNIVFYYALGMARLAIIAQQIYFRYKQGFTQDERFKYLIFAVKDCIKTAQKAIENDKI
jgi:hypothetical protein